MAAKARMEQQFEKMKKALVVGAVGGLFWSLLGYAFYSMNFTKLGPAVVVSPFFVSKAADKPLAQFTGMAVITALSIGFALLYVYLFSKYYTPWIGIASGVVLFALFFYALNPLFQWTKKPLHQIGMNTFSTTLSLFLLYGLFVGFSLSAEFSSKEPKM
ncbi:hypothetical protein BEP19_01050 [Ammoniphilus oxalaticus]|uniref:Uncharacterized protein n=1 Tax=Ammoniphilus oxalaticus TaxID=66863 RepID=A0A419SMU1_9BACL|nr:YqhR family membrane protein [Ammoniphilus oxalaticus]RKD25562.1 hypothetical protein BEP19_01050 [Ammoniphilus oxalaticus]